MRSLTIFFRPLILVIALLLCIAPHIAQAQTQDKKLYVELWAEAEAFRTLASQNFLTALKNSSTPEANLVFAELGELVWFDQDNADDWSIFFRHSLVNFVATGNEMEFVYFQNPWADITLLTIWSRTPKDNRLRIVDIGMLMSSVIRGARVPFPIGRGWMREKAYAPVAIGEINAKTTNQITDAGIGKISNPLASLTSEQAEAMVAGSALQWMEYQTSLLPLFADETGIASAMRAAWNNVMTAVNKKQLANVLPANSPIKKLNAIDPALWASLEPVAYIENEGNAVSIFASSRNPNTYAALAIKGDDKKAKITHFDFYQFSDFLDKDAK
ncbi:MAG: hypothetical protein WC982_10850 [Advenella sp.]